MLQNKEVGPEWRWLYNIMRRFSVAKCAKLEGEGLRDPCKVVVLEAMAHLGAVEVDDRIFENKNRDLYQQFYKIVLLNTFIGSL